MRLRFAMLLLLLVPIVAAATEVPWIDQPDWATAFRDRGVTGAALIYDEQGGRYLGFDRKRAETRFSPASTFKVFNALVALDSGAVKDEYEVLRWDGVKRSFEDWNRDHSLASAMKFSVVWFYQEMARRAGAERMQGWLDRVGYGNRDSSGGLDRFWLDGGLRISAPEQIAFLRRLADGSLPFSARAQEAVRRITILEAAPAYVLHAKTGWALHGAADGKTDLGWIVGWVERGGRRWFFALNIDMPHGAQDAAQRAAIARALLARAGALPAAAAP